MKPLLQVISCIGHSQAGQVNGIVISSENGEPLIGTKILLKGTQHGKQTGIDGDFQVQGLATDTLAIS